MQDEGIVQPASKEVEQLSRRLHQGIPSGICRRGFNQEPRMAARKTTRQLRLCDAAYIAGLIDGEGTVGLSRRHARDQRQLVVSIANTERQILEYVLQAVGTGKITGKRVAKAHHSPSFTFAVSNRQALDLLRQVAPFLQSYKAKRATLVIEAYVKLTPRNGKYTPELTTARREFEVLFLGLKPITATPESAPG